MLMELAFKLSLTQTGMPKTSEGPTLSPPQFNKTCKRPLMGKEKQEFLTYSWTFPKRPRTCTWPLTLTNLTKTLPISLKQANKLICWHRASTSWRPCAKLRPIKKLTKRHSRLAKALILRKEVERLIFLSIKTRWQAMEFTLQNNISLEKTPTTKGLRDKMKLREGLWASLVTVTNTPNFSKYPRDPTW